MNESDDPDWFDLAISISVEGRDVPFAPLFAALARNEDYLVLEDGSYLRTDLAVLDRLRELIEEARRLQDRPGRLRLNRYAASLWGDIEELADVVEQADRWRESVGALATLAREGASPGARGGTGEADGRAAAVPEGGVRLAGLPAPSWTRRHPRRRHGPGQDPGGAGPARARPGGAAGSGGPAVPGGGAGVGDRQLGIGGASIHPGPGLVGAAQHAGPLGVSIEELARGPMSSSPPTPSSDSTSTSSRRFSGTG